MLRQLEAEAEADAEAEAEAQEPRSPGASKPASGIRSPKHAETVNVFRGTVYGKKAHESIDRCSKSIDRFGRRIP